MTDVTAFVWVAYLSQLWEWGVDTVNTTMVIMGINGFDLQNRQNYRQRAF